MATDTVMPDGWLRLVEDRVRLCDAQQTSFHYLMSDIQYMGYDSYKGSYNHQKTGQTGIIVGRIVAISG